MPKWTHNPPCKAHTIRSQMFENGKIDPATTAKAAFSFHPEFSKFNKPVFYNNFKQLKQLHGLECMYILLFSIRLAIIIFSDIFYSKKIRKKLIVCSELFGGLGQL